MNTLSWRSLVLTIPFFALLTITVYDGHWEAVVAVREQKAEGVVTGCDPSNHNWCHYRFRFGNGHLKVWADGWARSHQLGNIEDYASEDRRERGIAPLCWAGVLTVVAIVVSSKFPRRQHAWHLPL